ncbi:MAG: type III-A CRISPR-associated RAMP protein Csm4 [Caldilineales bacterium]|nr:type III-A CRISPR-associated RAMP protein Csm4 [Caldilineales bacterium]
MPEIIPYHLSFHSGMRVGTHGVNLEETSIGIPSDTLFAALLHAWRRLGHDPATFADPFCQQTPPFLLSSAFPFVGKVHFFPMPHDLSCLFSLETIRQRGKALKRIQFLSQNLALMALEGQKLDAYLFPEDEYADPSQGLTLQQGALWLTTAEVEQLPESVRRENQASRPLRALRYQQIYTTSRVPRVTIQRHNSASNIFHAGRTAFAADSGLWFGVQWIAPDQITSGLSYRQAVETALSLLQDDGLGGERSTGYGAFSVESGDVVSMPDPQSQGRAWLFSRYHPTTQELPAALATAGAAYRLTSVSGWLNSPDGPAQRRKQLMLVTEGSLVALPGLPAGDIVDVRPTYENPAGDIPHPVYRYGFALAAGLKEAQHG